MTERAGYIGRIRNLARAVAQSYYDSRERLGFPMAGTVANPARPRDGSASLLVELQTEELPPRALKSLATAFAAGIEAGLHAHHFLTADSRVSPFGTPRRLAVHITHVAVRSADQPFKQKLMPLAVARDAPELDAGVSEEARGYGARAHGEGSAGEE